MAAELRAWCRSDLYQCAQVHLAWLWCWIGLLPCAQLQLPRFRGWHNFFRCAQQQHVAGSELFRFVDSDNIYLDLPHKHFTSVQSTINSSYAQGASITTEGGCYTTGPNTNVDEPSGPEFACCSTTYWSATCIDALSNGESYSLSRGEPCAPLLTCEPSLGGSPWEQCSSGANMVE